MGIAMRMGIDPAVVKEWPEQVYEDVRLVLAQKSKHDAAEDARRGLR